MSTTAYVFPGQGSQRVGMLGELADAYPFLLVPFKEVSEKLGYDLWSLIQNGPDTLLNQTEHTQVALLTADVALFELLKQHGAPQAATMAGHSLGEYAALVCAGALRLSDAATLVATRGKLMQQASPLGKGAMAAIVGLTDSEVESICLEASTVDSQVTPANYNAIGQVVVAGHTAAVERAILLSEAKGARLAKQIPVSVPCHCSLLFEVADEFAEILDRVPFKTPAVSVISNVDLSVYSSVAEIRLLLKEQLYRPVRWVETIQKMKKQGIERVVECGPGKVLSGLIKRIDPSLQLISTNDKPGFELALSQFSAAIKEGLI